jgi:hypothetical protein
LATDETLPRRAPPLTPFPIPRPPPLPSSRRPPSIRPASPPRRAHLVRPPGPPERPPAARPKMTRCRPKLVLVSVRPGWPALAYDRCRLGPWSGPTDPTMLQCRIRSIRRAARKGGLVMQMPPAREHLAGWIGYRGPDTRAARGMPTGDRRRPAPGSLVRTPHQSESVSVRFTCV